MFVWVISFWTAVVSQFLLLVTRESKSVPTLSASELRDLKHRTSCVGREAVPPRGSAPGKASRGRPDGQRSAFPRAVLSRTQGSAAPGDAPAPTASPERTDVFRAVAWVLQAQGGCLRGYLGRGLGLHTSP